MGAAGGLAHRHAGRHGRAGGERALGSRGPADLRVTVTADGRPASGGRPLEVTVTNVGGTSAENVIIEVTVGDVVREVDLDLVAKGDKETAAVVVPADATGPPDAEVLSYTNP